MQLSSPTLSTLSTLMSRSTSLALSPSLAYPLQLRHSMQSSSIGSAKQRVTLLSMLILTSMHQCLMPIRRTYLRTYLTQQARQANERIPLFSQAISKRMPTFSTCKMPGSVQENKSLASEHSATCKTMVYICHSAMRPWNSGDAQW